MFRDTGYLGSFFVLISDLVTFSRKVNSGDVYILLATRPGLARLQIIY